MRRYRAPQPPRSRYITPEGKERLSQELQYLWKVKRPRVTQAVAEAAAMGDRSENAEYIYGKKQLREIDARVRFLSKRLGELLVVDRTPEDPGTVYFGAWVRLEDEEGNASEYRIVGPDEFDPEKGYISIDSPMARALLKKTEGDEVTVERPRGRAVFTIMDVRYRPFGNEEEGGKERE
ncbi:MAG: transcription elongation factor GreB [Alphaproteobacteria bacterium]|uniref:Transcription elongation factor GreB n=1 Tax=Candidatus Nitrobium versatile TaxID=2884831 RepID=A0A953J8G5_9BACT|nr:transcription elongation factor GreB [Candidatus Nitrobium versatile]